MLRPPSSWAHPRDPRESLPERSSDGSPPTWLEWLGQRHTGGDGQHTEESKEDQASSCHRSLPSGEGFDRGGWPAIGGLVFDQLEQELVGLAKARRFLQRPEHFAAGFLRLARLAQQLGQVIVHFGRVGVVEQRDRAIRRQRVVPLTEMFGGTRELAVRRRNQRIDRQEPPRILGHAGPVAGRLDPAPSVADRP